MAQLGTRLCNQICNHTPEVLAIPPATSSPSHATLSRTVFSATRHPAPHSLTVPRGYGWQDAATTKAGKSCSHRAVESGSKSFHSHPENSMQRPYMIEKEHPCSE